MSAIKPDRVLDCSKHHTRPCRKWHSCDRHFPVGFFEALISIAAMTAIADVGLCERPSDVEAIERALLTSRKSLRSGHVELRSANAIAKGSLAGETLSTHCDVYFEGEMIRGDFYEKESPLGTGIGQAAVTRRVSRCFADGVFRWYGEPITQAPALAYIRPLTDSLSQTSKVPDPRLIGMCPGDMQVYDDYALNYLCSNPQWTFVEDLGLEVHGGVQCRKWKYRKDGALPTEGPKAQNILIVWVAPELDNNFVGMRREAPDYVQQVECRLKEVEGYGWFPSHVDFTRWDKGEISRSEKLEVTVHQFNKPIGRDFFQLAGMGVPNGSIVIDSVSDPKGKTLEMQSNGLVEPKLARQSGSQTATSERTRFGKTFLIINGVIVGVLALLLLWRRKK